MSDGAPLTGRPLLPEHAAAAGHVTGRKVPPGLYTGRTVHYAVPDEPRPGTDFRSANIIRQYQLGRCLAALVVAYRGDVCDLGIFAPAGTALVESVPLGEAEHAELGIEEYEEPVAAVIQWPPDTWHFCGPGECTA